MRFRCFRENWSIAERILGQGIRCKPSITPIAIPCESGRLATTDKRRRLRFLFGEHDVLLGAVHDGEEFRLLGLRNLERVERLLEVVEERLPFLFRDVRVDVRILHRAASVALWPARGFAHVFGHEAPP